MLTIEFLGDVRLLGEYLAKRIDALEARMQHMQHPQQLSPTSPIAEDAYGLNLRRRPLRTPEDFRRFEDTIANNEPAMEMVVSNFKLIVILTTNVM